MPLIELTAVTKLYRVGDQEIRALDGIDLTIEQGEFAVVIGPSGSGESTLMLGAKARHIFMQILIESTIVGVIGGLMGLVAAVGMTRLIAYTTDGASAPIIQAASVFLSVLFAVVIGVASGIYPAWRASRIAPIEALRYG